MSTLTRTLARPVVLLAPLVAVALGTAACASAPAEPGPVAAPAASSAPAPSTPTSAAPAQTVGPVVPATSAPAVAPGPQALPATSHVHAVARDASTGQTLVATHEGLYVLGAGEPRRVGPVIDFMGFSVVGPKHYLASGHPGPGTDLPQPVGLIETRDGGQTWTVLSGGGESDYHALSAGGGRVVGFDGSLRSSADGRTWVPGDLSAEPRALAASPDGRVVLATTADGLMRSTDGGVRWSAVPGAPLLFLVQWAGGGSVAGLDTDGFVQLSRDGGTTWQRSGVEAGAVQAIGASGTGEGLSVFAATSDRLLTWSGRDLAATS